MVPCHILCKAFHCGYSWYGSLSHSLPFCQDLNVNTSALSLLYILFLGCLPGMYALKPSKKCSQCNVDVARDDERTLETRSER